MSIGIGDKVRFLNDVGGGTIVKVLPKNMAIVEDTDGFEYPYPVKELVLVGKASVEEKVQQRNVVQNSEINVERPEIKPELKEDNISEVLFAFVRKKQDDYDGFETFLINDSNYYMFYHVVLRGDNGYEKLDAAVLEPNTKISVADVTREQINLSKEIIVQVIFYDHPYQTLHDMLERKIKIVPLKFFQEHVFIDNDFFDEKAYVFELLVEKPGLGQSLKTQEDYENNLMSKEEDEEDKSKRFKPRKKRETIELDLHINELVDSVIGMSNAEILEKQLNVFHQTMTEAISNNAEKVILIHGIGNGTLKEAVRESLIKQYKLQFEDASFKEYGFGATEVML